MQSHSMTEGAENLNLNGKHLDTEVFSEKTISLFHGQIRHFAGTFVVKDAKNLRDVKTISTYRRWKMSSVLLKRHTMLSTKF